MLLLEKIFLVLSRTNGRPCGPVDVPANLDFAFSFSEYGIMHSKLAPVVRRGFRALAALLLSGWTAAAMAQEQARPAPQGLLTNLSQLRACAEQQPQLARPFRIVGEVRDTDSTNGVLVLSDASGLEFMALPVKGPALELGATVCLEGRGCGVKPRGFGLAVVPGIIVDNDGLHPTKVESNSVFLRAGLNRIRVQWFNGTGDAALSLEYEGPDLPRQRIPDCALFRGRVDAAAGVSNVCAGLDYRCYEGYWSWLPDFSEYRPVKTGTVTNFEVGVRSRHENVGLEFIGFVNIPRDGAYTFYVGSDDGARLWVGESSVEVRVLDQESVARAGQQMRAGKPERVQRPWVTFEGIVNFLGLRGASAELQMRLANDDIRVDIFASGDSVPNLPPRTKVKVSGIYEEVVNEDGSRSPGVLRVSSWKAVRVAGAPEGILQKVKGLLESTNQALRESSAEASAPPAIVTVAEIKTLSPELARQEIPVSVRGVLTAFIPQIYGAVLQDSTRGIFVYLKEPKAFESQLKTGEYYQIDGVTGPGLFAPVLVARKITHLGAGQWPQPLHATYARLVNGSLDTQYAEIDGVVTAVADQRLSLLTEGGNISVQLSAFQPQALDRYLNAWVRIRGCVFAPFNEKTHELQTGTVLVGDPAVTVVQPAPGDLFDVPQKSVGELLLYDPEAAPLRLLKVSGQIVYASAREFSLSDGTNGLRIITRNPGLFAVGDLVDAVGFLRFDGSAAQLNEAVMRKTGSAPLPLPTRLTGEQLMFARYADTLVQVTATLMHQWAEGSAHVFELQSGLLLFRARMNTRDLAFAEPPPGSRLELTGVYAPLGQRLSDGKVNGFELLLAPTTGLRVLATPPWWTLKRVLALSAILAALLCAVLVWNKALHRQVQERTQQLETAIRHRERAEQQRSAETERARIARDLHDELGTGLTEVSLLASAGLGDIMAEGKSHNRFRAIAEKARALVSALDVIVWAIDPKRNSLQSFADYLGSYAEELLSTSNIVCRLRIPIECEAFALPGASRHSLFLAIKEALNNVIRHAAATEVELKMAQLDHRLEIVIADNGRGFEWNALRRRNGLVNLQERLGALHGQCHIESQPGCGTSIRLTVPLLNGAGRAIAPANITN